MNFASDNGAGAATPILEAILASSRVNAPAYGADDFTARAEARLGEIFERKAAVFLVATGTGANALSLAALAAPWQAVFCHEEAHVIDDECGAPEFFTHGAKLVGLDGDGAKLAPETLERALAHFHKGFVHHAQPACLSLTQATELGTVYTPDEIAALAVMARGHGMSLHLDGARFANALAHLGCTPAEATWRAGVDAMSFGATKNGALGAEAVIFFDPAKAGDFAYRRKKAGHLISKMRFVSAQLEAYLADGRWLEHAARANRLAARLAAGLSAVAGVAIATPVEANAVFAFLPDALAARLRQKGASFYDWAPPAGGRRLVRLVVSSLTPEEEVEKFLRTASSG